MKCGSPWFCFFLRGAVLGFFLQRRLKTLGEGFEAVELLFFFRGERTGLSLLSQRFHTMGEALPYFHPPLLSFHGRQGGWGFGFESPLFARMRGLQIFVA